MTGLNTFADRLSLPWHHLVEHPTAAALPIKAVGMRGGVGWAARLFKQILVKWEDNAALWLWEWVTKKQNKSVCHQSRHGEFANIYLLDAVDFFPEVF